MTRERAPITVTFLGGEQMDVEKFVAWMSETDGAAPSSIAELAALMGVKLMRQGPKFDAKSGETPEVFICDGFRLGLTVAALEPSVAGRLLELMSIGAPVLEHEMRTWAGFIAEAFEQAEARCDAGNR